MTDRHLPAAVVEFARLFDQGDFWDSHEALEPAWRASRSEFYHALILLASAHVHASRGNRHGVGAQLDKALPLFRRYEPTYLGFDVSRISAHAATGLATANDPHSPLELPAIRLKPEPSRVRGDEAELG